MFKMLSSTRTLLLSFGVTAIATILACASYAFIRSEDEEHQFVIASFPSTPIRYDLTSAGKTNQCFGSLNLAFQPGNNQSGLNLSGWLKVSALGINQTVHFDASMVFNALGQLSAAGFNLSGAGEPVRFGTLGVNPIKFVIYRGPSGGAPIFEQIFPGPIEIRRKNNDYQLVAANITSSGSLSQTNIASIPIQLSEGVQCQEESSEAIDLTPLLLKAAALSEKIKAIIPKI